MRFKTNLECAHCENAIRPELESVPEIIEWTVELQHPDSLLTVKATENVREKVFKILRKAGYTGQAIVDT